MTRAGKMHYLPAALIGEFAPVSDSGEPPRRRRVWVARRGVPKVFRAAAANVGFDPDDPQMYQGSSFNLDILWLRAEGTHRQVQDSVATILDTGSIPAPAFANVLVPYVAHLLARHPLLVLDGEISRLDSGSPEHDNALERRRDAFARSADALLTDRRWLLLRAPDGLTLVTNDLGWQWLPGAVPGEVFVPVSSRAAFVIRGGGRSYTKDAEAITIPVVTWQEDEVALRRDVMMLTAPKEIYASREEDARHCLTLWSNDGPDPARDPVDGELASPYDLATLASSSVVDLLQMNAAEDPDIAFARLIAIQHRWSCECDTALARIGDDETRGMRRNEMHSLLAAGERLLREQGLL